MKKYFQFMVLFVLVFSLVPLKSMAAGSPTVYLRVDGTLVSNAYGTIIDNYTMVPLRFVSEDLDAKVVWDASNNVATITKGNVTLKVTQGSELVAKYVGNSMSTFLMPVAATNINGSLYVPIRFVSNAFGNRVFWNETFNTVDIDKNEISSGFMPKRDGYSFANDFPYKSANHGLCSGYAMSSLLYYIGRLPNQASNQYASYRLLPYSRTWNLSNTDQVDEMLYYWWWRANDTTKDPTLGSYMLESRNWWSGNNDLKQIYIDTITQNIDDEYPVYLSFSQIQNPEGHAAVAYAYRRMSSTQIRVFVYDPNHPGEYNHYVDFYKQSNGKWRYIWEEYKDPGIYKFPDSEYGNWDTTLVFDVFDTESYVKN